MKGNKDGEPKPDHTGLRVFIWYVSTPGSRSHGYHRPREGEGTPLSTTKRINRADGGQSKEDVHHPEAETEAVREMGVVSAAKILEDEGCFELVAD